MVEYLRQMMHELLTRIFNIIVTRQGWYGTILILTRENYSSKKEQKMLIFKSLYLLLFNTFVNSILEIIGFFKIYKMWLIISYHVFRYVNLK